MPDYPTHVQQTVFASGQVTGATTRDSGDIVLDYANGIVLTVDITAIDASTTVTVNIQDKDETSGKFSTILASTALGATGTTRLIVYPGIAVTANLSASNCLGQRVRIRCTGTGTNVTYSIGAALLV